MKNVKPFALSFIHKMRKSFRCYVLASCVFVHLLISISVLASILSNIFRLSTLKTNKVKFEHYSNVSSQK
uniref:Uncharacterized protein n=1 Tax=Rhizophora mucronata TaxID=61149 RepID=A0A2P2PTJ3_RHIMU